MSASLKKAYELAEERHDLDYFKKILHDHQESEKAIQEEKAAKEAEKQEKAAKKAERAESAKTKEKKEKRKSSAKSKDTVSDEDEMDVDGKADSKAKPSKKRKERADSDGEEAKVSDDLQSWLERPVLTSPQPKKMPKSIKLKNEKTPNGDSAKKGSKQKKMVSKPEAQEEKEVLTDAQKLERREKAVLYLRHRLQKGFLTRDVAPKEEEMDAMAEFFTQLEAYGELEPSILRATKINKVLKGIVKLSSIPKEEEYNFKKRSNDLLAQWNAALDQNKAETPTTSAPPAETAAETSTETPAENGEVKANGDGAEGKGEAAEEAVKEPVEDEKPKDDVEMVDAPKEDKPVDTEEIDNKAEATAPAEAETAAA